MNSFNKFNCEVTNLLILNKFLIVSSKDGTVTSWDLGDNKIQTVDEFVKENINNYNPPEIDLFSDIKKEETKDEQKLSMEDIFSFIK